MKFLRTAARVGISLTLLCSLAVVATAVAAPKLGGKAHPSATWVLAPAERAPVARLIIRYKAPVKLAGQGRATQATERLEAAAQVSRSATVAGASNLKYLKSVSANLHVATLEQAVSPAAAQALMQRLRADAAVEDVVIDHRVKPHALPSDPYLDGGDTYNQWHLQDSTVVPGGINVRSVWGAGSTGSGVVVAVVDGGYRPHADLAANVLPEGYDFISADSPTAFGGNIYWTANDGNARDRDAQDPGDWITASDAAAGYCDEDAKSTWHGTHMTGLVGALANGSEGVGVAFGAKVLPVRVLGRCGGYTSDILAGARWAAGLEVPGVPANPTPAKVLNLSLGVANKACEPTTQSVIDEIRARNVSIVASAGNEGGTFLTMPANCKGVVAVTAHTREGDSADYANVGVGTAISAPGGGSNTLLATLPGSPRLIASTGNAGTTTPAGDNYLLYNGTSMAAPQVASVLALLASAPAASALKMATLEGIVRGAARAFPPGSYCATNPDGLVAGFCGNGLLDAQAALWALNAAPADSTDLDVSQRVSVAEFAPGQTVNYTLKVTNWGPVAASNVQLQQTVSAGLQIISVAPVPGVTVVHDAVRLSASTLAPGVSLSLNVTALVTASGGQVSSSATVSSTSPDPTSVNNSDVQTNAVVTPVAPVSDGGGGCTVATNGQADAGLVLLTLSALLTLALRRRSPG